MGAVLALTLGTTFGVFVLHPAGMLFGCAVEGAMADRLARALLSPFRPEMASMTLLFAGLGACLAGATQALLGQATQLATASVGRRPSLQRLCMYCKAMPQQGADGAEHWLPLEQVLYHSQGMEFSHGVCPSCRVRFLDPQIAAVRRTSEGATPQGKQGTDDDAQVSPLPPRPL